MTRLQANLTLTLAAMIWGLSFVVQQVGTGTLGAITFTGARFFLGGVVIVPLAWHEYTKRQQNVQTLTILDFFQMQAVGVVLFCAGALQQYGIFHTTVTNSGFFTEICVIFVPIIGFLCGRKIHPIVWLSVSLCLLGIWLLSGAHYTPISRGDLWVIASSVFWGIHLFVISVVAQRTNAPLILASVQFLTCGILGLLLGMASENLSLDMILSAWQGIVFMGVLSVAVAFTLQVVGQCHTPAPDAAIFLSLEAVFAALGGAIFLNERLESIQYYGAIVLLTAILLVELVPCKLLCNQHSK